MQQPLVSIVIPCWNAETFVGEAIKSALDQTYTNVEVIVVDDGSTDCSLQVIESFGKRIRFETGPNRGACAARNRGVVLARGELIQFLDADDLLHRTKLEEQVPVSLASPAEMIHCDWEILATDGSHCKVNANDSDGADSIVYALTYQIQTATPLHWKDTLERIGGFRESLPCAQERDLHIRLACSGVRFRRLPKVFCTIRRRPGSLSQNLLRVLDQHLETAFIASQMLKERGEFGETTAMALAGFLARDARTFLKHGEWTKATRYFSAARELHAGGGLDMAYGPTTRLLHAWLGPTPAELVARLGRGLIQPFHTASRGQPH
jgi:glycosyltransferase involved in cell wall biosynthesis